MTSEYPGKISAWEGYPRLDFELNGVPCILVKPLVAEAPGRPWLWRARFFGAFPFPDLELLKLGWHIAYTDVADLFGCPEAVRRFRVFRSFMIAQGFSRFPTVAGYSRGGLIAMNFAIENPNAVSSVYLDNAVLDFKSWPGGKGVGCGSPESWVRCLTAYGFADEAAALAYGGNPLDNLEPAARAGVPVLLVTSEADTVVPHTENAKIFVERYRAFGGHCEYIGKPGIDHHPHSLQDPTRIVDFMLRHQR